jgi:hypothetical protein
MNIICGTMSRFLKSTSVGLAGTLLLLSGQMARAEWPDVVEAKAIAEEGFIYGLPIVMNYAVQYEYSVDKNSGQYKAPFNQISNEARVFSYKRHRHYHAQQRHAVFDVVARSARRTYGHFGARR